MIDNQNPSSPRNVAFIDLLGNADMQVRNNILYADSYIDLVWFDISDPAKPVYKGRKEEVFPQAFPPTENGFSIDYENRWTETMVLLWVGRRWRKESWYATINHAGGGMGGGLQNDGGAMYAPVGEKAGAGTGIAGSMSRFAIYHDNLYTVMNNQLGIFDLLGEAPAKVGQDMYIGFNVETIFSYKTACLWEHPRA